MAKYFDMDMFAQSPLLVKLDRCTKTDLLLIAKMSNVSVPYQTCKAGVKQFGGDIGGEGHNHAEA